MNDLIRSLPGYPAARKLIRAVYTPPEEQWLRVVMNRETQRLVAPLQRPGLRVLEISGGFWGERVHEEARYRHVQFPDFDICKETLPERFDLIVAEQVFEHLLWPYRAGRNVLEMLAPGGHFLVTTPFLVRVHDGPHDCTRWTATGLSHFLAECGFPQDKTVAGSWGNKRCVTGNLNRWLPYRRGLHSLKNDPRFPIAVWALAKKSLT